MADKKTEPAKTATNFDVRKKARTSDFIVEGKLITTYCGACPASGKTCSEYDTTHREEEMM
jgi:hypothetical protein